MRRMAFFLIGLLVLALGAAGCGNASEGESPSAAIAGEFETSLSVGMGPGLVFSPNLISASVDQTLVLTIQNEDSLVHNFESDDLGVASGDVDPGGSTTVTFLVESGGSFEFFCTIPGHREAGMTGTITVY